MISIRLLVSVAAAFFSIVVRDCAASTFYIDYDAGSDSSGGTSVETPWKHCPGDPLATGVVASSRPGPGDTLLFKGGVNYRGQINWSFSGAETNRLVISGSRWGAGRAVISGFTNISGGWTRCASPSDCNGNPNFNKIWSRSYQFPSTRSPIVNLRYGGELLRIAAKAKVTNQVEATAVAFKGLLVTNNVANDTVATNFLKNPAIFSQPSSSFWDNSFVGVIVQPNMLRVARISDYDVGASTVHFGLGNCVVNATGPVSFNVFNNASDLTTPGEYCIDYSAGRILIWPTSDDPNSAQVEIGLLERGFFASNAKYVSVDGLVIEGYNSDVGSQYLMGAGLIFFASSPEATHHININNVTVKHMCALNRTAAIAVISGSDSIVSNCETRDCLGSGGITINANRSSVVSNLVANVGATGIYITSATNVLALANQLVDLGGTHANALSVYQNSQSVDVVRNHIFRCKLPITVEFSSNLRFVSNLVENTDDAASSFSDWGGTTNQILLANNTFLNSSKGASIFISSKSSTNYLIINNILGGAHAPTADHRFNLYTSLYWTQTSAAGWQLGAGEVLCTDLAKIWPNVAVPSNLNLSGPAYLAGTNLVIFFNFSDFLGRKWSTGDRWNVGCFATGRPNPPILHDIVAN